MLTTAPSHLIGAQGERTIHFRGSIKQEDKAILRRSYLADTWCHSGVAEGARSIRKKKRAMTTVFYHRPMGWLAAGRF